MPLILVILFVAVPLVELMVILQVGSAIGAGWTIVLLIADSVLGAWLLRIEGSRAWSQFRAALADGRWPGDEVAQGALVIVGGTLLLTPGFVTDIVGFLLLVPVTRRVLGIWLRRRVAAGAVWTTGAPRHHRSHQPHEPRRQPHEPGRRPTDGPPQLEVEVLEVERDPHPPEEEQDGATG